MAALSVDILKAAGSRVSSPFAVPGGRPYRQGMFRGIAGVGLRNRKETGLIPRNRVCRGLMANVARKNRGLVHAVRVLSDVD